MAAALEQGKTKSTNSGVGQAQQNLFPPSGRAGSLEAEIGPNIFQRMLTDDREGSICYGNPSLLFVFRQVCPVRDWSVGLIVCLGCIVHVHFSGDSLGMIALIISSHMIMLLLVEVVK